VDDLHKLFFGERLAFKCALINLAITHKLGRTAFEHAGEARRVIQGSHHEPVDGKQADRANDATDIELSSPMIAFCTVLDSDSKTTRSNGFSWASSRFQTAKQHHEHQVDDDGPKQLFQKGSGSVNM